MTASRFANVALLALSAGVFTACSAQPGEAVGSTAQADSITYDAAGRYEDRVRLLQQLKADHPLPEGMLDPRDGIVLQTQWQASSRDGSAGPDVIHATTDGGRQMLYGWWPNVNYTLTAWQMIALKERGEYENVTVTGYDSAEDRCIDASRFDASSAEARPVIDSIADFYRAVDATRIRSGNGELSSDGARNAAAADLQARMWRFHEAALSFALARNGDYLGTSPVASGCQRFGTVLPEGERAFAGGWGRSLVPLLAAVSFSTAEALVQPVNTYLLPQAVVTPADLDLVNGRSTLAPSQRAGVAFIVKIDDVESKNDGPIRGLLEKAGSNESFRDASTRFQSEMVSILDGFSRAFAGVRSGNGKAQGDGCVADVQCAGGLYCRNDWAFNFVCLPKGGLGEHCWTSEQCVDGMSCHWIAAHMQKEGPFYARVPHPARVCNPHSSADHPHQPQ